MVASGTLAGLDIRTLRLLVAAIEEKNLGKAAEREHISLSSVSRRIAELEARIGVPLLHRHDRGVVPTAAAASILPRLRDALGLLEQVVQDLGEHAAGARGVIRIKSHLTALAGPLPNRLQSFAKKHPWLEVEVEDCSSAEAVHAVRIGTADVGLVSGTIEAEDVQLLPWWQDEISVVLPLDHPLSGRASLRFAELLDEPFIGMQKGSALLTLYREQAALIGERLRERARVSGFEMARRLVASGLGISILPRTAIAGSEDVVVCPLDEPWASRLLMVCISDFDSCSKAARMLVSHLLESEARN